MTKDPVFAPYLLELRTVLEAAGLLALLLALLTVRAQRRAMRRLIDARIARGDAARRRAVRYG